MKELSLNILDIVENSFKAKAKRIELTIIEDDGEDLLSIEIKDDGSGMGEEILNSVFDPFTTSSNTKKVGLGLPFLKLESESSGGSVTVESKKGKGTTVRITFKKSHIDRPPLGDIPSTLVTIIATHPEVEFKYKHIVNGKVFEISTKELKDIFGETITSPIVLNGIKDFLDEEIRNLYGGV